MLNAIRRVSRQPLLTNFLPKSLERAATQRTWRSSQPAGLGQGWRGRAYSERFFNAHVLIISIGT